LSPQHFIVSSLKMAQAGFFPVPAPSLKAVTGRDAAGVVNVTLVFRLREAKVAVTVMVCAVEVVNADVKAPELLVFPDAGMKA
jgi:hypothetical protein